MNRPADSHRRRRTPIGVLDRLTAEPWHFRFGAAVRLLWLASGRSDPGDAIRFTTPLSLGHPAAEIDEAEAPAPDEPRGRIATRLIGLLGASSPLPRWYTELVAGANRARSPATAAFFDLLSQRIISAFAVAGTKYRPHLAAEVARHTGAADHGSADPAERALLALTGYGSPDLVGRLTAGRGSILHYAGFFATWPRSASRLEAMLSDWLERPVEIIEFAGAWLRIGPDEQSRMPRGRLPGQFNRLGMDCAAGARAYDQQARFVIRIGPLSRAAFAALLPDQPLLRELVSLVRAYVGMEVDFAVNLVLDPADVPSLRLGGPDAPRLSWTGWLPAPAAAMSGGRKADQAMFAAGSIEALPALDPALARRAA
ncbi:MAG: type VI secretion system baseplate subunit TssG [Rhodospirillales bacterium]|nr:type VI secretion system baseplate subunit TssG [Rhodospirillales bacterium]